MSLDTTTLDQTGENSGALTPVLSTTIPPKTFTATAHSATVKLNPLDVELSRLNKEYCFVRNPVGILYVPQRELLRQQDFKLSVANSYAFDGNKKVQVGPRWLNWEERSECTKLIYEPNRPSGLTDQIEGEGRIAVYNLYKPPAVKPEAGDIAPFNQLMWHIFRNDKAARKWFEQWLAYPLKYPGSKLYTAVVFWSVEEGAGKSLMGEIIAGLYGENAYELSHNDLSGNFNEWLANRQLVVINEIASTGQRRDADFLKTIITRQYATINKKYQPIYVVRDCVNYIITSNHPDAIHMQEADRRFFVYEIKRKLPESVGEEIGRWKDSSKGKAALLYYLQHEVSVEDFRPHGMAPDTRAKREMIEANRSDVEVFVADQVENANRGKIEPEIEIRALQSEFESCWNRKVSDHELTTALKKYGAINLGQKGIPGSGGKRGRFWLLTNKKEPELDESDSTSEQQIS